MLSKSALIRLSPILFVLMWSTGFVGARLSAPFADPLTFLAVRFVIAGGILLPIALLLRQPFPPTIRLVGHSVIAGALIHAIYLGSVFYVVRHGMPIAIVALIVGLQPVIAACLVSCVGAETLSGRQWRGVLLGLVGVCIVLSPGIQQAEWVSVSDAGVWRNIAVSVLGLLGITLGALYQKRYCHQVAMLPGAAIQYFASAVVILPAAFLLEEMRIEWNGQSIFAMLWLVFVLSIGAVLILLYLIKQKAAVAVSALFYLSPALAAIWGFVFFGEALHPAAIVGLVCSLAGVYLVTVDRKQ